jgi:starch synthase
MKSSHHIIMLASENDALIGGKVGGVGDVVRDLPRALAALGWKIDVITPSYGFLHKQNPAKEIGRISFPFRGKQRDAGIWSVTPSQPHENINHLVLDHPELKGDPIYYNDPPGSPFKRDAAKYALFCSAAGQYLQTITSSFTLHLHDWHTGTYFLLRELHPAFSKLKGIKTAFTIHNLAIQGTRPMQSDESSVEQWFPELFDNPLRVKEWIDPRYEELNYTPMAAGIRYADNVNTVSPGYAEEILIPSDHKRGFYGGEGLENILKIKKEKKSLFGILNGCEYPRDRVAKKLSFPELFDLITAEFPLSKESQQHTFQHHMIERIGKLKRNSPAFLFTSVTRIVDQKIKLLFEQGSGNQSAIDGIMNAVTKHNGMFIIVGRGTTESEQRLIEASTKHERLIFLNIYDEKISRALYTNGTMFIMPSLFEPCGISQMLAMREGQPCIVHAIGGLKDTVIDNVNGFAFGGMTVADQVDAFVRVTEEAIKLFIRDKQRWEKIRSAALNARYTWESSALKYIDFLYS